MRSIIQHLRFPFSYLLLPVFLMAISKIPFLNERPNVWLLFVILHVLVYPSSNAYNSLQDQDEGSIGLVKKPLPINKRLSFVSIILDITAILLSLLISIDTSILVLIYISTSRLYSYRKFRLKKYPIIGFLTVFIFQGIWIYFLVSTSIGTIFIISIKGYWIFAIASSFLIGAIYPLSQIYQHDQDKADGVTTISYILGKKGTFIFSGIFFLIGSVLFVYAYFIRENETAAYLFLLFQLPSLLYFNYWFYQVIKDEREANFKHTMRMNLISATCMNLFFGWLILQQFV